MNEKQHRELIDALKGIKSELSSIGWMSLCMYLAYLFSHVKS
jgi:hypothetical protein